MDTLPAVRRADGFPREVHVCVTVGGTEGVAVEFMCWFDVVSGLVFRH